MNEWIDVKTLAPPKNHKFLFSYPSGTGLGNWGTRYETRNGNSEFAGECYHLISWPEFVNQNNNYENVMELDEEKMKYLEMNWMLFPESSKGRKMNEWIKCSERMPCCFNILKVKRENGQETRCYFHADRMAWLEFHGEKTNYWQEFETLKFLFDVVEWFPNKKEETNVNKIKVKHQLPQEGQKVIFDTEHGEIEGEFFEGKFWRAFDGEHEPFYWKPLIPQEAPK